MWKKVARPILRMDRIRPGTTTAAFLASISSAVRQAYVPTISATSCVRDAV
jgi:hypothetical protein